MEICQSTQNIKINHLKSFGTVLFQWVAKVFKQHEESTFIVKVTILIK